MSYQTLSMIQYLSFKGQCAIRTLWNEAVKHEGHRSSYDLLDNSVKSLILLAKQSENPCTERAYEAFLSELTDEDFDALKTHLGLTQELLLYMDSPVLRTVFSDKKLSYDCVYIFGLFV